METRANHALIGAFTLGVLAAAFTFVFWFNGASKSAGHAYYAIVFPGSVSGLTRGSTVLFNGLRIGEVSKLELAPDNPSNVMVSIDIDARTPMRKDTLARLEYSGITGVASIALTGGSNNSERLPNGQNGNVAVIQGDRSDFANLINTGTRIAARADDVLNKLNHAVDENTGSLSSTLKNAEKFSKALADNADGVSEFLTAMSDAGRAIKPLAAKLETLTQDVDGIVKAVDPEKVKTIVAQVSEISVKLNAVAGKLDTTFTNLNGFLATEDNKGMVAEISDAAKSIKKLADNLDIRTKEITSGVVRFTGNGLKQYEQLAVDARQTVGEVSRVFKSLERNPQQLIFGAKEQPAPPAPSPAPGGRAGATERERERAAAR
jgi:phospholipid/cholesterol/gamma-HCH transport system substrate-binding protein